MDRIQLLACIAAAACASIPVEQAGRWSGFVPLSTTAAARARHPHLVAYDEQKPGGVKKIQSELQKCARRAQWQRALVLINELRAALPDGPPITATNLAAAACTKAGRFDMTLSVLYDHVGTGGAWDSHSYSTAIAAYGKRGQWRAALQLLEEMEEGATLAAAADGDGRGGDGRESSGGESSGGDDGGGESGDGGGAAVKVPGALPATLVAGAAVPTPLPNVYVYGAVIGACAVSGRYLEALSLLGRMEANGMVPTAL